MNGGSSAGTNLEGSADTEDTVVGLLSGETLDSGLDDVVLFGDQVVEPGVDCQLIAALDSYPGQAEWEMARI